MALSSLYDLPAWDTARRRHTNSGSDHYCSDRLGHTAVCIKDELLVWGGYNESENGSIYCDKHSIWSYNLDLDIWRHVEPSGKMPQYRSGACSALIWPNWYIFCGHTYEGDVNDIYSIDLINLKSTQIAVNGKSIPPRDKASCWVWNFRIYVFGGYGPPPYEYLWDQRTDRYSREHMSDRGWNDQVACFNPNTSSWEEVICKGPKPSGRAAHSTVQVKDVVYIFGGRHQSQRLNDLHVFRLADHSWSGPITCQGQLPEGRSWHTMSQVDQSNLLLYGGFNNANVPLSDVWLLNMESHSWTCLKQSIGKPRLWHTSNVNCHGDVLVFGGSSSNILSDEQLVSSSKVILFRTKPFALERLCLHSLIKNKVETKDQWSGLPREHQAWLSARDKALADLKPALYSHNVELGIGPSLKPLTLLTEEECKKLNSTKRFVEYVFHVY